MYKKLESFGLKAGKPWQPEKLDPAVRSGLQKGLEAARDEMKNLSEGGVDAAKFFGTREHVGTNYMDRAMGVYMGIFGNVPKVSVYLSMPADAAGKPLDGSKGAYTLTFAKGQLPPVKYFWSITMYSIPQRLLVENPIKRYSIGSSTPGLQTNGDGSLTIYVSEKSPGRDKESNWLPAPSGPFWTVLRNYGPDNTIIDGTYKRPDYVAASAMRGVAAASRSFGLGHRLCSRTRAGGAPRECRRGDGAGHWHRDASGVRQGHRPVGLHLGLADGQQMNRRAAITRRPSPVGSTAFCRSHRAARSACFTSYIDPGQTFVTCPNQDVVYGLGFFSLDEEPVVSQVPDFGDRFWVYAMYDARTDQFAEIGKPYKTKPGFYLLVGPNWKGEKPAGIEAVIRSSTALANAIPRVFMDDTDGGPQGDPAGDQPDRRLPAEGFRRQDEDQGLERRPRRFPVRSPKAAARPKWVVPEKFFDQLGAVLDTVAPLPGEEALYAQFRVLLDCSGEGPGGQEGAGRGRGRDREGCHRAVLRSGTTMAVLLATAGTARPTTRSSASTTSTAPARPSRTCSTTSRPRPSTSTPTTTRPVRRSTARTATRSRSRRDRSRR